MEALIQYDQKPAVAELSAFVESYWMLVNTGDEARELVILPDGRIDMFFSRSLHEPFHATLSGIETRANKGILAPKAVIFAISFKLSAVEFLFGKHLAGMINTVVHLPNGFKGFCEEDLSDFEAFCQKANNLLHPIFSKVSTDSRKHELFHQIYTSKGSLPVKEIAEKAYWSSRQINRYFNDYFGLNLKAYCNILRFRSSFSQIKEGKFFPEDNFADQAHFIKEIKKYASVTPKTLNKNENDRFIQFSLLS